MANLYVISGCNGAGKTTASYSVLPDMLNCKEFVNADEIAKGLSPFQPDKVAIQSGRIMLNRMKDRVISGGHNIPEEVIYRRYSAGINHLSKLYLPICDYWLIIDNSEPPFKIVAEGVKADNIEIFNQIIYDQIVKQ
jgi:predicted ABC-type ATPase